MTSEAKICPGCGKTPPNSYENYCSWDCCILAAEKQGGKKFQPNGLPIRSINHNGDMFEHEDADHPDYKFPITMEYIGTNKQKEFGCVNDKGEDIPLTPEELAQSRHETMALIYTDGCIALARYECCYFTFTVRDGNIQDCPFFNRKDWRLTEESRHAILAWYSKNRPFNQE